MKSQSKQSRGLLRGFFALFLTLGILFLVIFVVFYTIYLTSIGTLSSVKRSLYITGTTIGATLLTAWINTSVQNLFARRLDCELGNWHGQTSLDKLNYKWRAVTNLDDFSEKFRNLAIHTRYWIVALLTTTLVVSLTPTTTTRDFSFKQKLRDGPSTQMSTTGNCTAVSKLPLQDPSWPYYWNIGNNMAFVVQTKQGDCPTRDAQIVVGNINTLDADVYAYMDAGVAVHRSALGVPRSVYSAERVFAPEFHSVLDAFGNSIVATRQCSRVMARNPISCHRGGKIVWKRPWFNISADDGLCDESQLYTTDSWDHYNNAGGGAMIKTMCPHHEIGQGTMVIGASGGYAHWLAVALDDTANAPKAAVGSTYAITCTVDARSVFEYREVSLLLQNRDASQSRYMRFLNATDTTCTGPPIIRDVIATAASANWQTFLQQAGADGWFDLVWEASNRAHASRTSPFGFAESKNPLEDVLGLVSAMVTARMNSSTFHEINSTAAVLAARVGDGRYASIAFALPPLLVVLILSGLIIEMLMRDVPTVDCTQLEQLINLR